MTGHYATRQGLKKIRATAHRSLESSILQLAQEASIEINVQDLKHLEASRAFLRPGSRMFVTFLPKQQWDESRDACRAIKRAGFEPVPHVPVRLMRDAAMLNRVFAGLIEDGGAQELLLLSGDYPHPEGPYTCVEEVLSTGVLRKFDLRRVSFAGHPEGHPQVSAEDIRRAELAKALGAATTGLHVSIMTQFFFEAEPFLQWVAEMRAAGVQAQLVGGLVGTTKLSTLFKFAARCGAGPSIRALGERPSSLLKLIGEQGPERVLRDLAKAHGEPSSDFDGVHLFCFGGFLRTCRWLHAVASGHFSFNQQGGFDVKQ